MSNNISYREYNVIDVLKLVLAIFVMIIHSGIDKTFISPLLRTAVPLFFIISSYFFFSKNKKLLQKTQKNQALLRLVKRNLFLYLFWSIIQLPIVIYSRGYHLNFVTQGMWYGLRDILLGNGFTGSWYIIALVVGVVVVFLLSKKISPEWLVIFTLPVYITCCLITNYYNLFDINFIVLEIGNGYHELTGLYFYTSFPIALFWVSVGRFLAEKKLEIKRNVLIIIGVIFGALLSLERYYIVTRGLAITDDCYFMLIFICPVIFLLICTSKFTFFTKFRIREFSVLIYVTHGCCGRIVGYVMKLIHMDFSGYEFVKIIITFLVIILASRLLIHIREKDDVKILKYAY